MHIHIDQNKKTPVYQQIVESIKKLITEGKLPPGTKIPASRKLAEELGINRLTVERAYQELVIEGLLETKIGSGTFSKSPPLFPVESMNPEQKNNSSLIAKQDPIFNLISYPPFSGIDFACGNGDPGLFPLESFRKVLQKTILEEGENTLVYGDPQGYQPLRESISQILSSQGMIAKSNQILITSGSHQGIFLVCKVLLNPGETIFIENPTYAAGLNLFRSLHLNVKSIDLDSEGMKTEILEKMIKKYKPKLIYTIPNYHNPTGVCMSIHRRVELLKLATKYNIPILEDDYVGDLRYDGIVRPPLKSLDQNNTVIYTGTFSKMLMPGIRVGYLIGTDKLIHQLTKQKYLTDLTSNNLLQHTLHNYVTIGRYQQHINRACRAYKKRRDIMNKSLKEDLSTICTWNLPQGGFFFWLKIPHSVDINHLLLSCKKVGVNFAPGRLFFNQPNENNYIRLNFAATPDSQITEGINRLKNQLMLDSHDD